MTLESLRQYSRSLKRHPGVPLASFFTVMGFIAGVQRTGNWLSGGLFGAAMLSVFWVPVLWTAWTLRELNDEK